MQISLSGTQRGTPAKSSPRRLRPLQRRFEIPLAYREERNQKRAISIGWRRSLAYRYSSRPAARIEFWVPSGTEELESPPVRQHCLYGQSLRPRIGREAPGIGRFSRWLFTAVWRAARNPSLTPGFLYGCSPRPFGTNPISVDKPNTYQDRTSAGVRIFVWMTEKADRTKSAVVSRGDWDG